MMKFGLFYLPTYLPGVRDAQQHYRGIIEQVEFAPYPKVAARLRISHSAFLLRVANCALLA